MLPSDTNSNTDSDLRERLLVSALEHFAQRGVDAASLRAIARDAGTSVGMITYYFSTKDGLFFTLVDRFYEPFRGELEAIAEAHEDPLDRLCALLRRIASLTPEEALAGRALIRELTVQSPRVLEVRTRFLKGHVRLIVDTLQRAITQGETRDVPMLATLPALIAPFLLPQLVHFGDLLGVDHEAQVEATLSVLLDGLRPR